MKAADNPVFSPGSRYVYFGTPFIQGISFITKATSSVFFRMAILFFLSEQFPDLPYKL